MTIGMVCFLSSCIEGLHDFDNVLPAPGEEVSLSASLNTPKTRTVYGAEGAEGIKVKWVHNDQITVYGTTCSFPQADYAVKTYVKNGDAVTDEILSSTPNVDTDGQNYADELVKTGESGVQWGSEPKSDFYAVYPAISGKITPTSNGVTVPVNISSQQYNSFSLVNGVLTGTPYNAGNKAYGMNDAIMYAYTKDAVPTDDNGNPKTVDLNFKPFSTVMKFHISSWYGDTSSNLQSDQTGKSIKVNSITLTAPYNIAGNFNLSLNGEAASAQAGTTNKISIIPSEEIVWTYGQALEFSAFVIPVSGQSISKDWKVTITANDGARTFSLKPQSTADNKAVIEAGMIHKLNVAGFPVAATWAYNPATWLTTVPRNVYISDISLPGAWYAADSGYQEGSLQDQYEAGIRAFNIDCRLTIAAGKDVNDYDDIKSNQYADNAKHVTDGTLVLACAGTETHKTTLSFPDGKISSIGKTVKQALIDLGKLAAQNTEEYIEVILTVAQKPKDYDHLSINYYSYGTVNAKMVLEAIALVLNDNEVKPYLYGNNSKENITPESTVKDVCGKLLVKVNANTSEENIKNWKYTAPMLISEGSMASSAGTASNYITAGSFTGMNTSKMYWAKEAKNYESSSMTYYYHQCQNTTGSNGNPSVANRQAAIQSIIDQSYSIYSNNTHDAMFQIGIGGWTSDNSSGKTSLSSSLNAYVLGEINKMLAGTKNPAPVGAVLMNFATSTSNSTKELIKAIIDLNGKYFLNRDTTKPAWPSEDGGSDEGGQDDPNQDDGNNGGSEGDQGEV